MDINMIQHDDAQSQVYKVDSEEQHHVPPRPTSVPNLIYALVPEWTQIQLVENLSRRVELIITSNDSVITCMVLEQDA